MCIYHEILSRQKSGKQPLLHHYGVYYKAVIIPTYLPSYRHGEADALPNVRTVPITYMKTYQKICIHMDTHACWYRRVWLGIFSQKLFAFLMYIFTNLKKNQFLVIAKRLYTFQTDIWILLLHNTQQCLGSHPRVQRLAVLLIRFMRQWFRQIENPDRVGWTTADGAWE